MTRLDALRALYDAVKAGETVKHPAWSVALGDDWKTARNAYGGRVGAALAFIEDALPGWPFVTLTRLCDEFDAGTVTLSPSEWRAELSDGWRGYPSDDDPDRHYVSEDHPTPATALLLAGLAALMAEEDAK